MDNKILNLLNLIPLEVKKIKEILPDSKKTIWWIHTTVYCGESSVLDKKKLQEEGKT